MLIILKETASVLSREVVREKAEKLLNKERERIRNDKRRRAATPVKEVAPKSINEPRDNKDAEANGAVPTAPGSVGKPLAELGDTNDVDEHDVDELGEHHVNKDRAPHLLTLSKSYETAKLGPSFWDLCPNSCLDGGKRDEATNEGEEAGLDGHQPSFNPVQLSSACSCDRTR